MNGLVLDFGGVISRAVFVTLPTMKQRPVCLQEHSHGAALLIVKTARCGNPCRRARSANPIYFDITLRQGADPADHKQFGDSPCATPIF
jgi:hypothetical protein